MSRKCFKSELQRLSKKPAFHGAVLSLVIQGVLVVMSLATTIVLARILGPDGYGVYSFALAIVMLLQVLPSGGLGQSLLRFIPSYRTAQEWGKLRGLIRGGVGAALAYGSATAVLATVIGFKGLIPAGGAFSPRMLASASLLLFLFPLMDVFGASVRALDSGVRGQLPQYLIKPLAFLILIGSVSLLPTYCQITPVLAMLFQGVAVLLAAALGGFWLMRAYPDSIRHATARYEGRYWLGVASRLAMLGGVMLVNMQADILMLGSLTTAHDTGIYRVAVQGASLVALPLTAANLFIAPRVANLFAQGELVRLQKLLVTSSRATFFLAACAAAAFWFFGHGVLELVFGSGYLTAYEPIAMLCVAQLINVAAGSVGTTLSMTGNEKDALVAAVFAAGANIGLNLALIPRMGAMGAALATTITMLLWNGIMLQRVWRRTGLVTSVIGPKTLIAKL